MRTGTFSQIYGQFVFAVRNPQALIDPSWENTLYRYFTGIVKNKGQLMFAIQGHWDHMHFLIAMSPDCVISDLVRETKKASTKFINEKSLTKGKFSWQEGYGAFSYSQSQIGKVMIIF